VKTLCSSWAHWQSERRAQRSSQDYLGDFGGGGGQQTPQSGRISPEGIRDIEKERKSVSLKSGVKKGGEGFELSGKIFVDATLENSRIVRGKDPIGYANHRKES